MKNQSYNHTKQAAHKPSRFLFIAVACLFLLTGYNICQLILSDKPTHAEILLSLPESAEETHESIDKYTHHATKKPAQDHWQIIEIKPQDTLSLIFKRIGQSPQTLDQIIKTKHGRALAKISPHQTIKIKYSSGVIQQLIYPMNARETLEIIRKNHLYQSRIHAQKIDNHEHFASFVMRGSLYNSAKQQGIPYKLVQQMNEIFKWEINFAKEIRQGDTLTLLYEAQYIENKMIGTGHLLAVSITTKNKKFQVIRYKPPQ